MYPPDPLRAGVRQRLVEKKGVLRQPFSHLLATLEAMFVRDTGDAATRQAHANFLSTYHMTAEQMPLLSTRVAESCSLCRSCSRNHQTDMTRPGGRAGVAAQPTLLTEGIGAVL